MPPSTRARPQAKRPSQPSHNSDEPVVLFGLHAVEAALRNPARPVQRLVATENAARKLKPATDHRGTQAEILQPRQIDKLLPGDTVHQGVCLFTTLLPEPSLDDLAEAASSSGPLVVLDQVTDPHNVGAILRSCAVFGACGLVMTRRHSPPLTGTLAKSASGALELIPIATVQNLAKALAALKASGLTILGLDGAAANTLEDEDFKDPTVVILGAEGKGLRQLTRETCNKLVRISVSGDLASLNVSNAAAVALHVASQKRHASTNL